MEHRPEIGQFCFCFIMFDRKTWNFVELFWRFWLCGHKIMDVMYFTRHVVAWYAACQSPIGSYRLLGGNMLTRGILTRGMFWSDGPRLPSFDRTAHQYAKFEKKVTNYAGICWHVACWHVAGFDRTVHVYRAGTCHVEMINCEKVRLPRQICNFLYFRGFTYGIQVFCFSKVLFCSFASLGPNGSGAPLEQKMIEGLFVWFPFLCGLRPEFILIYRHFLEGYYVSFLRKILIKIIHWIIPPGDLLSLPACDGAPHYIPVSTAYHPYIYKDPEKRLGRTWRLIMGAWRWVPIGTSR
jgi:hypothetical protein